MQRYTLLFILKINNKQICVYKHCLTIEVLNTLLYVDMDLKDFVSETLKEIIEGVKDAQEFAKEKGAIINPSNFGTITPKAIMSKDNDEVSAVQRIDFSLSLKQGYKTGGKIGVEILDLGSLGGEYQKISENRVNFSVLVILPTDTH